MVTPGVSPHLEIIPTLVVEEAVGGVHLHLVFPCPGTCICGHQHCFALVQSLYGQVHTWGGQEAPAPTSPQPVAAEL
jgi:hypothetical protein